MEEKIVNARIKSTMLGREDHGIMTFMIFIDMEQSSCGIGGYAIDMYDKEKFDKFKRQNPKAYDDGDYDDRNFRIFCAEGLEAISEILYVVGVDKWEDLPGQYIRVVDRGWGSTIDKIGNIVKDRWFNLREFFSKVKS